MMDNQEIKGRFNEMERMRDFILWLCEEELNDTVTACHERFLKWQEAEENAEFELGTTEKTINYLSIFDSYI